MATREYGNTMKVIALGLDKRVLQEMMKPGFSAEGMSSQFKEENINISPQSIRKFIKKSKGAQQKFVMQELDMAKQLTKTYMDYGKVLKNILDEVKEVKDIAKDEKDMATYNQMVDKLYKGVELIAKLTGDIKPKGSVDINIIYNEITADVEKMMKPLKQELFKEKIIDVDYEIEENDRQHAEFKIKEELTKMGEKRE